MHTARKSSHEITLYPVTAWLTGTKSCVLSCLISVLLFMNNTVIAAPTGGDLLQVCTESVRDGFDTMKGKMCTWYVTPCDCNIDKTLPMVCLPESVPTETLANVVISGLAEQPDLQQQSATRAAALILSVKYPCPARQQP